MSATDPSGVYPALTDDEKARGKVCGCDAFSPASLEPTNPGFFWYGIHGVEILYTIMGTGCQTVRCTSTNDGDLQKFIRHLSSSLN